MSAKKKLLFIIPSLEGGGSEKVLSIILKYISSDRFNITLAVVCRPGIYYKEIPATVKKINLNVSRNRHSLRKVHCLIKSETPDLVITFNVNHIYIIVFIASFFLNSKIKYVARESTIL